jgi:hypothetical protein
MKLRQKAIEEAFKLTLEKVKDAAEYGTHPSPSITRIFIDFTTGS